LIYECDQCSNPLSPGITTCSKCGEKFDQAVPADAQLPKSGFSAKPLSATPVFQAEALASEPKLSQALAYSTQGIDPRQVIGLIGASILFIGTFAPIVSMPVVGSQNYFQNGKGDGTILIGLAVISALLTLLKKYEGLWLTSALSLGLLAFTFLNLQAKITGMEASMKADLVDNPFAAIGNVMLQSIQLQWGWAVLVVGALFLVAAALRSGTTKRSYVLPAVSGILLLLLVLGTFAYTKQQQEQLLLDLKAKSDQMAQNEKARQNAEQTEQQAKQDAVNKLNLVNWQWDNSNQFSRYLVGSIRNDSNRNITFISIEFELLDDQGNKVGSAEDLINSLSPGETWKFRAMAGPETASRAQLSSLKGTVEPNTNNAPSQATPVMPAVIPTKPVDEKPVLNQLDKDADTQIRGVPLLEKRLKTIGYVDKYFSKVTLGDDYGVVDVSSTKRYRLLSASKQNAIISVTKMEWQKIYTGSSPGIVEVMDYSPEEMTEP
jgi:hypothetical protein